MEKKKKFQMPHTYIIIFGVILFAAILTMFIPLGKYETKEITYIMNGECGVFNPLLLECLKEIQDQIRAHDVTPQEN